MSDTVLALDVGERKVGVARAHLIARIAEPLTTLQNTEHFDDELQALLKKHDPSELIVGLPRGLDGQETPQTAYVRNFVTKLEGYVTIPIHLQDEAVTSIHAREILESKKKQYTKEDVDALAAMLILDDYLLNRE